MEAPAEAVNKRRLIWIDLEMTGLNPDRDAILEIATVVTDGRLEVVAQGPVLAIHQGESVLARMDKWNVRQHTRSGLVRRVRGSLLDALEAERITLEFLREHVQPKQSPMCGNTICQDRRFLYRFMPELEAFFHYRHLDVSTVRELARCWQPTLLEQAVFHSPDHQALLDVRASIEELRHYRRHFFSALKE